MSNKLFLYTIKAIRKIYTKVFAANSFSKPLCIDEPNKVSQIMYDKLISNDPCMIARFGAFELSTLVNYLAVKEERKSVWKYISGKQEQWWWNKKLLMHMQNNAGFFPSTEKNITQFCDLTLEDIGAVDVLGSWLENEHLFLKQMNCVLVQREIQNPFFAKEPWTRALKGKKVLVIHPFASIIEDQYANNRELLFENKEILPLFDLITLKAVQSIGGVANGFNDWFEALQWMKDEIDKCDYDICLVGAGAYGFPLAAHVKRKGKKAVHLGGSLQLLFGIKGNRWEDPNYNKDYNYAALMNQYWVKPGQHVRPKNAGNVEGACYW